VIYLQSCPALPYRAANYQVQTIASINDVSTGIGTTAADDNNV
jgi:hypothetical protein